MTPSARLTPMPYFPDSQVWYQHIRHLPYPIWLDSGRPQSLYGRFDILAADPQTRLVNRGSMTDIHVKGHPPTQSPEDFFSLLQAHLPPPVESLAEVPFCGGALGYFGYELGSAYLLPHRNRQQNRPLPDAVIGIYEWAIVQDHEQARAWLVQIAEQLPESVTKLFHDLKQIIKIQNKSFKINGFRNEVNEKKYAKSLGLIKDYILAGDCYQVNYAQRFHARCQGDLLTAYLALREALPSPFSAFMEIDHQAVLCLSPERFVRIAKGMAETQPIKGTIARGSNAATDRRNAAALQASAKDRAENLMIVDLLRNDLSKHCTQVEVPALFALQSFANVHHLVSTITARLPAGVTPLQVFKDCFPGGSITGAPKRRAMEIIDELEPISRSIYCGSLGYISADGAMDTNIAIRTLAYDGEQIYCWGGGGITADSEIAMEYQESLTKVRILMDTLEKNFIDEHGQ